MSAVRMNDRMDVDFEVAVILLQMASGLPWKEFMKKFSKVNNNCLTNNNTTLWSHKPKATKKRKLEDPKELTTPVRKSARKVKYTNFAQKLTENKQPKKSGKISWRKVIAKKSLLKKATQKQRRECKAMEQFRSNIGILSDVDLFKHYFSNRFCKSN